MAFYPFPEVLQGLSRNMSNGNFGLWYNKFIPLSEAFEPSDEKGEKTRPVDHYCEQYRRMSKSAAEILKRKHEDMENFCESFSAEKYEEIIIYATLNTPLTTGIGESHPHEISMVFDHNMGIPYVPASGVKGIVRFAHTVMQIPEAIEKGAVDSFNDEAEWTCVPMLFGTQKNRGKVVFLDAYPAEVPELHTDIMNPHYGPYYSELKPPADHHNPTPIKFLTVKVKTSFIFRAVVEKEGGLPEKVRAAFTKALTEEGVGAKTAVGYGRFTIDEKGYVSLMERRKQRQLVEESRRFPWRVHLIRISHVEDWGQFKQILSFEPLTPYRHEKEVAEAVKNKALEIRDKWRRSWEDSRDSLIAEWLKPAGLMWEGLIKEAGTPVTANSEEYGKIEKLVDWGAFKSSGIDPGKLPADALQLLLKKMESWGCHEKKAKEDKRLAYKRVKELVKKKEV